VPYVTAMAGIGGSYYLKPSGGLYLEGTPGTGDFAELGGEDDL